MGDTTKIISASTFKEALAEAERLLGKHGVDWQIKLVNIITEHTLDISVELDGD